MGEKQILVVHHCLSLNFPVIVLSESSGLIFLSLNEGFPEKNKAGYMATLVACGWAGAVIDKATGVFWQGQLAQNAKKRRKSEKRHNQRTDQRTDKAGHRVAYHATKNA